MEYISIGIGVLRLLFDAHTYVNTPDTIVEEWVYGRADYNIHSEITEAEACRKAEARAKLNAIQKFNGEYIASDSFMSCKESGENVECPMHTFTWSMLDGLISGVRNRTVFTTENLKDQRVCRVVLEARVISRSDPIDPNFDIQVNLSHMVLRDGDPLTITVNPTQEMYLNILVEDHSNMLTHIFPNKFDSNGKISNRTMIPISESYSLAAKFPSHLSGNETQEVVHILSTQSELSMLDTYSIEDFHLKLLEIPNHQKRYVRKAYRLIK